MKVLLVEDEIALADVLARGARAHGHEVDVQGTAEGAMLSMMEDWPDALVLDVNLPDASGWEVLRGLSAKDRELLQVVMISGSPISQIRLVEFRPDHCLLKPFPLGTLLRALEPASTENTRNEEVSPQS
jgi:DNA-binding response OmpR family regulator